MRHLRFELLNVAYWATFSYMVGRAGLEPAWASIATSRLCSLSLPPIKYAVFFTTVSDRYHNI